MRGCRIPRYLLGRDELPLVRRPSVYNLRRRFTLERVERNATPPRLRPSRPLREAPPTPRLSLSRQARHLVLDRSMPRSWG
jgi:hypothetical protein